MALKKFNSLILFRASLCVCLFLLASLTLFSLTAIQSGKDLSVVAQFFSATENSGNILGQFSQLKTFSPMEIGPRDKQVLNEMFVRYYLQMRYEQIPDANEMIYRWGVGGPVSRLSRPSLYNEFAQGLEKKIDALPDVVITVEIKAIDARSDNTFKVDFVLYEHLPKGQIKAYKKNVNLGFAYIPQRKFYSPKFNNPYGFTVISYKETFVQ